MVLLVPYNAKFYPLWVFLAVWGGFVLFFGLFTNFIKSKLLLSDVVPSMAMGILLGPYVANVIDPYSWEDRYEWFLELTRLILAIQLMATALSLPRHYLWRRKWDFLYMVGPVLVVTFLVASAFSVALLGNTFSTWGCFLLGAIVTPTDPVIASAVVRGRFAKRFLPPRVRKLIAAESGANDGLAYPIVFLPIVFLRPSTGSSGAAIGEWFYLVWLYRVLLPVAVGLVAGKLVYYLLTFAEKTQTIDKVSFLALSFALTFAVLGAVRSFGGNAILAVFVAGVALGWGENHSDKIQESQLEEAADLLVSNAFYIFFGTIIPFDRWSQYGVGRLIGWGFLVLLFKRFPHVTLSKPILRSLKTWRETAFLAWFGPVGVAALFYSLEAFEQLEGDLRYFEVITFILFLSVLVHGLTAAPFSKYLRA